MSKLDLDWLRIYAEIYKTASVTAAAERLGLAQSVASTALNKMRGYFADPLFSRTNKGMRPTPVGQQLFQHVDRILQEVAQAREGTLRFDPAEARRDFRVCMTDTSEVVLLPTLIDHFSRAAPFAMLSVELIAPDSPTRMQEGTDIAIGFMPQLDAGFHQRTLFTQDFVCLVAKDHPRVRRNLTIGAFVAEGHVVVTTAGTGHYILDKAVSQQRIDRRVVLRVPSFLGVAKIVANTHLIGMVPRRLGQTMENESIRIVELPFKSPTFSVKQYWHSRVHRDAGHTWLRQMVAELFAKQS